MNRETLDYINEEGFNETSTSHGWMGYYNTLAIMNNKTKRSYMYFTQTPDVNISSTLQFKAVRDLIQNSSDNNKVSIFLNLPE